MQLVVVTAVNAAVNAAITTRMRISQMFLFSFIIDNNFNVNKYGSGAASFKFHRAFARFKFQVIND